MKVERMSPEEEYQENMKLMRKRAIMIELCEKLSMEEVSDAYACYMNCKKCRYYGYCYDEDGKCINTKDCDSIIFKFIQTGEIR